MSATLIAPKPTIVAERPPRAAAPEVVSRFEIETAEMNRWLRMLVPPFFLSGTAFAFAIATGWQWLIGVALFVGPTFIILAFIYLGLTSESNGE
ncbi:MAG: hypothetical protein JO186_12770 [Actinobacteria bacterium]|nr:hypothetical protein [Actinomycetota bacterium]